MPRVKRSSSETEDDNQTLEISENNFQASQSPVPDAQEDVITENDTPLSQGISSTKARVSCNLCGRTFTKHQHLKRHMRGHTGEKPYKCTVCNEAFNRSDNLKYHMQKHGSACVLKYFPSKARLKSENTPKKQVSSCDVCGKYFTRYEHLRRHVRSHTGERPYVCTICGRAFNRSDGLKSHMRIHGIDTLAVRRKSAPAVDEVYRENREETMIPCEPEPDIGRLKEKPSYGCSFCGKSFTRQSHLTRHVIGHTDEKPFKCMLCDKLFARAEGLMCHLSIHFDDRVEEEDAGGRWMESSGQSDEAGGSNEQSADGLAQDEADESVIDQPSAAVDGCGTPQNPLECGFCNNVFARIQNLRRHLRSFHTGEKPYVCSRCGQGFARSDGLKKHVKMHEDGYVSYAVKGVWQMQDFDGGFEAQDATM